MEYTHRCILKLFSFTSYQNTIPKINIYIGDHKKMLSSWEIKTIPLTFI